MSRTACFIVIGTLWTLTTSLLLASFHIPELDLDGPAGPLAASLLLTAALFFASGLLDSLPLRLTASYLHVSIPSAWAFSMAFSGGLELGFTGWVALITSSVAGAALCDIGLSIGFDRPGEEEEMHRAALGRSGRFARRGSPLAVTDSGTFRLP